MSEYSCYVWNLRAESISGFHSEKEALSSGGHYLNPDENGYVDATDKIGLCVICENCGAIVTDSSDGEVLTCPDCGESIFRVVQSFCLRPIESGFTIGWHTPNRSIGIEVPYTALEGMLGIYYTTDGSDPTLSSSVYENPIPYRKAFAPIRAAVFYQDARSQIIEWDYDRAEKNRKRIQKNSGGNIPNESTAHKAKPQRKKRIVIKRKPSPYVPEPPPYVPEPPPYVPEPPPTAPTPPSEEEKKRKEKESEGAMEFGCGLVMLAIALICNDCPFWGWGLLIFAVLGLMATLFGDK